MPRILYWSQVYSENDKIIPVFFFHPDLEFLSHIREFGDRNVPIYIHGTEIYDGPRRVVIDSPTQMGSCPMDCNPHQPVLAAFLPVCFTIYPPSPGSFTLMDA